MYAHKLASLAPAFAVLIAIGCAGKDNSPETNASMRDSHSYAVPSEARVTHVHLDLAADFEAKKLSGTAILTLDAPRGADKIILDTRDLDIHSVTDSAGVKLEHTLGAVDSIMGQALEIRLPSPTKTIRIDYATRPGAAALQWLTPEQTAGKQQPFLFSQGQAILTRSWIPTQDSPGIRQTYSARITVPASLRAVMSAEQKTPDGIQSGDKRVFEFVMPQAVPPYLIAIAIGDIAFRSLGPRSGVYAEPSVLDRAATEFADIEKMMAAAERLYGEYRWGRYDVLVLPPSFPFGGMENPRLTFATPTILAGDKSLVSLIAHELAHSWSGNLVTNATWRDFWLNEGFTSYIELRIMEELYGKERAEMLELLARQGLVDEIAGFGADTAQSRLHIDLTGRNPDDGMTAVAYDKGATFLRMIELRAGREKFDSYLRSYFERNAFRSITTSQFVADLREHLLKGDKDLEDSIRLDEWVYGTGLPENAPVIESAAFKRVEATKDSFIAGRAARELEVNNWSTQEWLHFLGAMPDTLAPTQLRDLDATFKLSQTGNSEILFAWLRIAIRNRYEPAFPALRTFLTSQGRRKFLRPLYEDLMAREWGKPLAREIYAKARPTYHSVSTATLDAIVK